jgi:Mlc titration factor MtfA (ptsG expression regulator)
MVYFFLILILIIICLYNFYLPYKLDEKYKRYLKYKFEFYKSLSTSQKLKFESRVKKFIDTKEFVARGSIHINDEIMTLVAASAIQLSFGYPDVNLRHFRVIIIYPRSYKSTITKQYHEGEVNVNGVIVLSWEAFKSGFADNTDGRNLALHEMAHALIIENFIDNGESDFLDSDAVEELKHEATLEIQKINNPNIQSIYRKYASTNFQEFFAVSTELFFEQPQHLLNYNSIIYNLMCRVLRQNPLSRQK